MPRLSRIQKLEKAILLIDTMIDTLHTDFDPNDREIRPAVLLLDKAKMTLENHRQSLERSSVK